MTKLKKITAHKPVLVKEVLEYLNHSIQKGFISMLPLDLVGIRVPS